ncbi:MAG: chitobiase/beta-hexosaminidase C-terminal domain-containing protein, partial [Muribaculaceae bacterium]|nr:chitobiase/beta-hexosaminidase C-terminal domain-containing protein [Muribaculaceae bacterium]
MKKLSILLLFAIMAIFQAQAATTTITFSLLSLESKPLNTQQEIKSDGFHFIFTGGAYYRRENKHVRFTQNSTLKILRKPTMAITKIKYICDPNDNPPKEASECKILKGQGNVTLEGSTLIWTGCANTVQIQNISSTTWRMISVEITYGETEVAAPTFSPEGGEYSEPQSVTIASATQGATISYSTDGGANWATYQSPVAVTHGTTTIQAKATYNNTESKISTATYKIKPATVTLKDLMTQGSGAFDVADASM